MKQKEIAILYSYISHRRVALEHEVSIRRANLRYRDVDIVDCYELASALQQLETFIEFSNHVLAILNLKPIKR